MSCPQSLGHQHNRGRDSPLSYSVTSEALSCPSLGESGGWSPAATLGSSLSWNKVGISVGSLCLRPAHLLHPVALEGGEEAESRFCQTVVGFCGSNETFLNKPEVAVALHSRHYCMTLETVCSSWFLCGCIFIWTTNVFEVASCEITTGQSG